RPLITTLFPYTTLFRSFKAIGKAVIENTKNLNGFCEIVIDQENDTVLGLNMIGPHVTELINEISLFQFMNGSTLELGLTTHAHPDRKSTRLNSSHVSIS